MASRHYFRLCRLACFHLIQRLFLFSIMRCCWNICLAVFWIHWLWYWCRRWSYRLPWCCWEDPSCPWKSLWPSLIWIPCQCLLPRQWFAWVKHLLRPLPLGRWILRFLCIASCIVKYVKQICDRLMTTEAIVLFYFLFSRMNICTKSPMIPMLSKISAILKIGKLKSVILIKSLTPPSRILSIRFPNVHAMKNPRKIRQIFLLRNSR